MEKVIVGYAVPYSEFESDHREFTSAMHEVRAILPYGLAVTDYNFPNMNLKFSMQLSLKVEPLSAWVELMTLSDEFDTINEMYQFATKILKKLKEELSTNS